MRWSASNIYIAILSNTQLDDSAFFRTQSYITEIIRLYISTKFAHLVKLGRVEVGSNIACHNLYLVIICSNSDEKLTKSEIR